MSSDEELYQQHRASLRQQGAAGERDSEIARLHAELADARQRYADAVAENTTLREELARLRGERAGQPWRNEM